ncbi:hypothetical protein B0H10DRAFT_2085252 [Mycena sp. CBHHK59/15]|nr:hypothetical protein B0H10DRAFT_2085252 [Mycena sp. CBHHK59/15]
MPALVDIFRQRSHVLNSAATLMNSVSTAPYFTRFLRTPAGAGIAALQAKRVANSANEISNMGADDVAEICQFLSTILLLQGLADVEDGDKTVLLQHLQSWEQRFGGRLASETAGRCLALLTDDPVMRPMMEEVKQMLESKLDKCGGPGCVRRVQKDNTDLLRCGRCKTAVYCGVAHQKAAWASHKAICFTPSF